MYLLDLLRLRRAERGILEKGGGRQHWNRRKDFCNEQLVSKMDAEGRRFGEKNIHVLSTTCKANQHVLQMKIFLKSSSRHADPRETNEKNHSNLS